MKGDYRPPEQTSAVLEGRFGKVLFLIKLFFSINE